MASQLAHFDRIYHVPRAVDATTCAGYIRQAEREAWTLSDISHLNPLFSRDQSRIVVDIDSLYHSIRTEIPESLDGRKAHSLVAERTICVRYRQGQYFGPHTDHPFSTEDGSGVTLLSLVLYLNDDYSGGETFFTDLQLKVAPVAGLALLFDPNLRHQSMPIVSGEKYAVRSEVLYIG